MAVSGPDPVRRDVTMLVTDLTHFTAFADVTEPEYVYGTLAEYHTAIGDILVARGGTIFDIAGDVIFAVFDGPTGGEDAPRRAVEAALEIHRTFGELLGTWRKRGQHLGFRIVLNSGFATFGHVRVGSYQRNTAVGSTVYATFHLDRAARSGEILATQRVAEAADGIADVIARPDITLSALTRKLDVFELRPRP